MYNSQVIFSGVMKIITKNLVCSHYTYHLPYGCHGNEGPPNTFSPTSSKTLWKMGRVLILLLHRQKQQENE